jgi:hypothetical protein
VAFSETGNFLLIVDAFTMKEAQEGDVDQVLALES